MKTRAQRRVTDPVEELLVARRALRSAMGSSLLSEQDKSMLRGALRDVCLVLRCTANRLSEGEEK